MRRTNNLTTVLTVVSSRFAVNILKHGWACLLETSVKSSLSSCGLGPSNNNSGCVKGEGGFTVILSVWGDTTRTVSQAATYESAESAKLM